MSMVRMQIGVHVESYIKFTKLSSDLTAAAQRRVKELSTKKGASPSKALLRIAGEGPGVSALIATLLDQAIKEFDGAPKVADSKREALLNTLTELDIRPGRRASKAPSAKPSAAAAHATALKEAKS